MGAGASLAAYGAANLLVYFYLPPGEGQTGLFPPFIFQGAVAGVVTLIGSTADVSAAIGNDGRCQRSISVGRIVISPGKAMATRFNARASRPGGYTSQSAFERDRQALIDRQNSLTARIEATQRQRTARLQIAADGQYPASGNQHVLAAQRRRRPLMRR